MPTYGFKCKCGEKFEVFASITVAPTEAECPICRHKAQRDYNFAPEFNTWTFDPSKNNADDDVRYTERIGFSRTKGRRWV